MNRGRRVLATAAFGLTGAALVTAMWLAAAAGTDVAIVGAVALFVLATGATGALVAARRPQHPIGWLLLAAALSYAIGAIAVTTVQAAVARGVPPPGGPLIVWLGDIAFGVGTAICATWLLLLFPTGRLPSPRWRPVAWLAGVAPVALLTGVALGPDAFAGTPITNPLQLDPVGPILLALEGGGLVLFAAATIGSVASLVVRHRRAHGVEREQLQWVALAAIVVGGALGGMFVWEIANGTAEFSDEVENLVITVALAAVPVAMGIAILRHRLFDIDRVVSRTVSYVMLTGILAALYAAVATLPAVLFDVRSDLLVAAATLLAAAAFGPLRHRIQTTVDRRFNRARYDARRVVDGFAGRLRDTVDLGGVSDELLTAARRTVEPAGASLWLSPTRPTPVREQPR